MPEKEFAVGDTVFVVDFHDHPTKRTTVTAVKPYKRGPRVTLADDSEWDPSAQRSWGSRGQEWYRGGHIKHASQKLEDAFEMRKAKNILQWAASHIDELDTEHVLALGAAARAAYKAAKERE